MTTLTLTRGLPGSGKTTWAKEYIAEHDDTVRVNRDDLRMALFGKAVLTFDQERTVTAAQHAAVRALLGTGRNVIVDDTNLRAKYARAWADLAVECGAELVVNDEFLAVPYEVCITRDARRFAGEGVGWEVIDRMRRFLGNLQPVTPTPQSERVIGDGPAFYVPDLSLPPAWLWDVDGTLAHNDGHRAFHDYSDAVSRDTLHEHTAEIARAVAATGAIVVMSGRSDECRAFTHDWLLGHHIPVAELHMRAEGDHRDDRIVKGELFDKHVRPRWNVRAAFDDRDRVVQLWRSIGLPCLQVAPGDF